MTALRFSLNHMATPGLPLPAFFDLAASLGMGAVEIRNDLAGNAILDGTSADEVRRLAEERRLEIVSINALQRFNEWNQDRCREADQLIAYAADCGAKALVLVPVNDGSGRDEATRGKNLRQALAALRPMLERAGVTGLVEPLGFETCSLRSKREAMDARADAGGDAFKLVHDTFHHHLAGEPLVFPSATGLVHISGVGEKELAIDEMRDAHRILVDADDRLANVAQIRELLKGGYSGYFSFEPFAPSVHEISDPAAAIGASMKYLTNVV